MSQPPDISDIAITIPVFNQLHFTKNCLASLNAAGVSDSQIIIVDNASTDGTAEFLAARPKLRVIHNRENVGCGQAWTQGSQAAAATWTLVLNNDVLIPPGAIEGLLSFAEEKHCDIVSPAMREGEADYDFAAHAAELMRQMQNTFRRDVAQGVAFMVHRRVFEKIGYFDGDLKVGGYVDDEFFRRARHAKFRLAITGRAFLHHFGSVTQKSIKSNHRDQIKVLGDRASYRRKTGQTWLKRKWLQMRNGVRAAWWKKSEINRHGKTLWEKRVAGEVKFY